MIHLLQTNRWLFALLLALLISACSGQKNNKDQEKTATPAVSEKKVTINQEAQDLLNYLIELGDYANSRNFPSLIKASVVAEELGNSNLVVDLRDDETYGEGHIKGAVNVDFGELPKYFSERIKPFEYERIILVCYSGQISSYATSLLRLMGYGNVYSMRWGMSVWNENLAEEGWLSKVSSDFEDKLEKTENSKSIPEDFPLLQTNGSTGEEIMDARINQLFEEGYSEALITAEEVFEDPESYYIINYDRKDKYEAGHIPGTIRYKPGATLGIRSEMQTIPPSREVVVYCGTGHNSGFVTAYLRLFGYNARTLLYGNNAFMYEKMKQDRDQLSWLPFTKEEVHDFPLER